VKFTCGRNKIHPVVFSSNFFGAEYVHGYDYYPYFRKPGLRKKKGNYIRLIDQPSVIMVDLEQPLTSEAGPPQDNEPSSKRQKLNHEESADQRDQRRGIAPIKPE
jgi:hypothetical protein